MEPKEVVVKFMLSHEDKLKGQAFINAQILDAKRRLFDFCNEKDLFLVQKNEKAFDGKMFNGTEYAVGIVVYDPNDMRKEREEIRGVIQAKNEPLDEGCVSCEN